MLGFRYDIPEDFRSGTYSLRSYDRIREHRPNLIQVLRSQCILLSNYESKPDFILYLVINTINNKLYVGATKNGMRRRITSHFSAAKKGSSMLFHRAIRKYGKDAFEFLIYAKLPSFEKLMFFEKQLIASVMPEYNSTSGGEGAPDFVFTEELRLKKSRSAQKQAERQRRQPRPKEVIEKMVASRKARGGFIGPKKGIPRTPEVIEKIKQNVPQSIPIICVSDGREFRSVRECALFYEINHHNIHDFFNGRVKFPKTLKGLSFKVAK